MPKVWNKRVQVLDSLFSLMVKKFPFFLGVHFLFCCFVIAWNTTIFTCLLSRAYMQLGGCVCKWYRIEGVILYIVCGLFCIAIVCLKSEDILLLLDLDVAVGYHMLHVFQNYVILKILNFILNWVPFTFLWKGGKRSNNSHSLR